MNSARRRVKTSGISQQRDRRLPPGSDTCCALRRRDGGATNIQVMRLWCEAAPSFTAATSGPPPQFTASYVCLSRASRVFFVCYSHLSPALFPGCVLAVLTSASRKCRSATDQSDSSLYMFENLPAHLGKALFLYSHRSCWASQPQLPRVSDSQQSTNVSHVFDGEYQPHNCVINEHQTDDYSAVVPC